MLSNIIYQFTHCRMFALYVVAPTVGFLLAFAIYLLTKPKGEFGRIVSTFLAVLIGLAAGIGLATYKQKLPPKDGA